ncbi:hypothetical protein BKA65DRAFT_511742 [Rhexocercosporidium sp. MPI-PUGE-AT-0058]|nr:hypothetical protein BKA65DRAFT_511742 [Rhexocercosporidium sp. MPI-PUGE-AT-0058]
MPPTLDEIEFAPPYQNGIPTARPSLVSGYDSPSPEVDAGANHRPDIKPPPPKRLTLPPADPLQKLLDLPILRPIPWKEGQELAPKKSSEHERIQVRSAVLLTTRGDIAENPCDRCSRGVGRFAKCVYKDGWFMGACATCQMNSKGNLCSFRTKLEAAAKAKAMANKKTGVQERFVSSPADTIHVNGPSMKRKRVSTDRAVPHKQSRTSSYQEYTEGQPSAAEEGQAYEKTFDDDPNALLQYVYNQQQVNTNGGTKRHHHQYQAERDDHIRETRVGKLNGHDIRRESFRGEVGEGSFSPAVPYGSRERSSIHDSNMAGTYNHHESREALPLPDEPLPLIDTFPRKKQKQLFAIIGSLQSGIRTSRQQTENLQRQLESLQTILGIDPEEVDYN